MNEYLYVYRGGRPPSSPQDAQAVMIAQPHSAFHHRLLDRG